MQKLVYTLVMFSIATFSGSAYSQALLEIEWYEPEKYTDVRASYGGRQRFKQSTFKRLDEYILKLAQSLPDGHKLKLKVTDLDLAGHVWPSSFVGFGNGASDIRVIKGVDIPRMYFSYQLIDGKDDLVQQADVKLKDMAFLQTHNSHFSKDGLRYEKNMLKRWFNQEFKNVVEVNKS